MKQRFTKQTRRYTRRDYNLILKSITPGRTVWWKVSGIFYGYPQCCIDAFCRLDHIKEEAATGDTLAADMGKSTGFIPCRQCAEKLHRGELKLKDLICERKSPLPFPRCSNQDMDLIYEMVST